jgi:SAM-dependent methyltransferase
MPSNPEQKAAFDATAKGYDVEFTSTAVGKMQRGLVWAFLTKHIFPFYKEKNQKKALELNCGTGEDAVWIAKNNWQVLATDISPRMVEVTLSKADESGLKKQINSQCLGFHQISELNEQFDLVFSNFGGLNCISEDEISKFGVSLFQKINSDGFFIGVIMGRFCWWESLYFLLKRNTNATFRRLSKEPILARLDATTSIETWYYSPITFLKALNQQLPDNQGFELIKTEAIGFWLPPSYLDSFFKKLPFLLQILNKMEKKCRGSIWAGGADHFLICLKKKHTD